jgi:hypothetical protein
MAQRLPGILELPGNIQHSELHFFTQHADQAFSLPNSMAWMTGLQFLDLSVVILIACRSWNLSRKSQL